MKIALSTRERAALSAVMHRGQWGGDPGVLLAQARLYRALKLGEFLGQDGTRLARSNAIDRTNYDLGDEPGTVEVLRGVLSAGGQNAELGLLNAGVLERLDPVAAVEAVSYGPAAAAAAVEATNHEASKRKVRRHERR